MPMVIARAEAFGLTGYETAEALDENKEFFSAMEAVRKVAGEAMGMGDVSQSVTPKFGLLAAPKAGGTVTTRYFMPWKTHPTMAVTGAQCLASCVMTPGTVADGLVTRPVGAPVTITLEHPSGLIDVMVDHDLSNESFKLKSAGLVRTARKLAAGEVFVPSRIWSGA